jgi:hypothetical protein
MVTIGRFGRFKFQIYADDHHPPHFHIICPEFEVLVLLSDLSILKGRRHEREIAGAIEWAANNHELLVREWNRLNEL